MSEDSIRSESTLSAKSLTHKQIQMLKAAPKGAGYSAWIPHHLIISPAWTAMSPQAIKLVMALVAEHAAHDGLQNGELIAPYDYLTRQGVRRETILDAALEAQALGVIGVRRGTKSYGSRKVPSKYRLTWLNYIDSGTVLHATHEWKAVKTDDEAKIRVRNAKDRLEHERAITKAAKIDRADRQAQRRAG